MPSKINRELATASYVWDIRNFASLVMLAEPGFFVVSPHFNTRSINETWKFFIHPSVKLYEDYIGFYLYKINISNQAVYNFKLSIGKPNAKPVESYKFIGERFVGRVIGKKRFLSKKSNSWILKGPVRFRCDITKIDHKNQDLTHASSLNSSAHINVADTENLSLDLAALHKLPFHSDLTVNMSGNEVYVHKYMLYARFPNMTLFRHRTFMEMPPSIEIEINEEIFELLMHYIYTGKLRDSYAPLELIRYARSLGLASLIQCVHEQAYSYHIYSDADVEEKVIGWNLDELNFLEEGATCVHILRTTLYAEQLAIQVIISDGCGNQKFIDVSFKFFGCYEDRPIILISKISLTSEAGLDAFKVDKHVFLQDEQWNFPRLLWQKHKEYSCNLMRLTVELSMSDWSNCCKVKGLKTKTKLHTKFQTVSDNLEYLRSSMALLLQMAQSTSNLVLLSEDNKFFRVHDGIMWARWPGIKKLLDEDSSDEGENDLVNQLELKLPSEVLDILLPYMYTGFIANFDREKASMLLKYSSELEYPHHLVKKCEALLSVNHEN